jgi:hypothetical protein
MKRHRIVLGIAAAIAVIPVIALLLWSVPNVLFFVAAGLSSKTSTIGQTLLVPVVFVIAFFPLWVFGSLITNTVKAVPHCFGIVFWSGFAFGFLLTVYLYLVFAPVVALVVAVPLLFLSGYAYFIQRNLPQPGAAPDEFASASLRQIRG